MVLSCHLGLPTVSLRKIVFFFNILNPLLTKLIWARWLNVGLVLFLHVYLIDQVSESVHKHAKIKTKANLLVTNLTSCLVNSPYVQDVTYLKDKSL